MPKLSSPDRPERILEAAARLIVRYGFDKTTMDDIAGEAGVSKGALYLVWPGKEQLFTALLDREWKRLLGDLRQRLEQDPEGGQMANLYRHSLLALKANSLMCALYTRDARTLGDFIHRQDVSRYTGRLMMGSAVVKQMQAAGLLRSDLRPEAISYLLTMMSLGFLGMETLIPASESPTIDEISSALSAMVERGLGETGGDSLVAKAAMIEMIEYMIGQG